MRKEKANYHGLFGKTTALKIALVVVSFMFINILNLPMIISAQEHSLSSNKHVLQLENKLGKIYSVVNLPIMLMNELFQKEMAVSGASGSDEQANGFQAYALFVPVKKNSKKSGDASLSATAFHSGGNANKFLKAGILLPGIYYEYGSCCSPGYLESNDIIRYMLLFLMLFLMLPRGIPVKIKNFININFAFPVFISYKAGIFHFLMECKGSVK